jgi:hypothetical protein
LKIGLAIIWVLSLAGVEKSLSYPIYGYSGFLGSIYLTLPTKVRKGLLLKWEGLGD